MRRSASWGRSQSRRRSGSRAGPAIHAERILGTADIARRFGVTRQRVGQIVRTDRTFPRPGLRDGAGDAWVAGGVECWAAAHRPTAETGRFGPEAAALLRHAEALAEALNQGYVDTAHLWHAIASGVAGDALAAAVCSMGLDPGTIGAWLAMHVVPRSSSRRMTPWTQDRLEAADRLARDAGRTEVPSADIAIAFLDSRRQGRHSGDHLIAHAEQRGLDTQELRDRVGRAGAEPEASFVLTPLPKRRPRSRRRRRPAWMDLAPNPLGHDPWERQGWGSVFAVTQRRSITSMPTGIGGSSSATPTGTTSARPRRSSGRLPVSNLQEGAEASCPGGRGCGSCRCRRCGCATGPTVATSPRTEAPTVAPASA